MYFILKIEVRKNARPDVEVGRYGSGKYLLPIIKTQLTVFITQSLIWHNEFQMNINGKIVLYSHS